MLLSILMVNVMCLCLSMQEEIFLSLPMLGVFCVRFSQLIRPLCNLAIRLTILLNKLLSCIVTAGLVVFWVLSAIEFSICANKDFLFFYFFLKNY